VATFGDLVVRLGLDKTQFSSGVASARGSLSQLKTLAVPAAAAVAAVGGALTAAAVAFKEFVSPSFEALDTLGDLSSRLGVATDKLAALQYAAGLAGIEQESLTTAVGKFLDTLSNAANGVKTAQQAFGALGLATADLRRMELDQQLAAVADKFREIKNPADRIRIAMDLFGKSGAQMLQLMNDGGQSLITTLQEARSLGVAPSADDVAKIQSANDAIDRMNAAWKGVANTVAIESAPAVEKFATAIQRIVPAFNIGIKSSFADLLDLLSRSGAAALTLKEILSGSLVSMSDPFPEQTISKRFKDLHAKIRGKTGGKGGPIGEMAPDAPLIEGIKNSPVAGIGAKSIIVIGKGTPLDTGSRKDFTDRQMGQLRPSVAPGGMRGAQDTLSRILRAGSHTKDPNTKSIANTEKNTASMAKSLAKIVDGDKLIVGLAKAGA
jgi:hypothetical protein